MRPENLFYFSRKPVKEEICELLLEKPGLKIERILSLGQRTPGDEWLDQERDEWVILIQGASRLSFRDPDDTIALVAGDYLFIAAHRKHRVEWTDPDQVCIWLAVHNGNAQKT